MATSISVVIPSFNSGALLVEALQSVLDQTDPVDEIIVVDDGSTDDTAERVERLPHRIRYIRQSNGGVSSARNRGILEAHGEWIAFLDADDVWHPRKIEFQRSALQRQPNVRLLGTGRYDWPAKHPTITGRVDSQEIETIGLRDLMVCNLLATSTIVARREQLIEAGLFDSSLQGPEDHDLWIRVARMAPVASLSTALTGYRSQQPGSVSKNIPRMEVGMQAILRKLEEDGSFAGDPLLRRRAWSHYWQNCAIARKACGDSTHALRFIFRSLCQYPFPLKPRSVRPFPRVRLLLLAMKDTLLKKKTANPVPQPTQF